MKLREENKILKDKLMRTEYTLEQKKEEAASLKEKNDGFIQLLEINQQLLMWALFQLSEETEKIRKTKVPMSEVYEIAKEYITATKKEEENLFVRFEKKE